MKTKKTIFYLLSSVNSLSGFTLIELMVALGIMALVSVVAIPNLRNFFGSREIEDTAAQLINVLRRAQSSAASRIQCPVNGELSTNWSVVLANDNYTLKSQCNTPANNPTVYSSSYAQTPTSITTFLATNNKCTPNTQTITIFFSPLQTTYQCSGSTVLPLTSDLVITINPSGTNRQVIIEPGGTIR